MKKVVLGVLIAVLALGIVAFIRLSSFDADNSISASNEQPSNANPLANVNEQPNNQANTNNANKGISLSTLGQHDSASDCWVGYGGKVYDVTSFLPNHDGSAAAIIPYCGTYEEFTKAFEGQHGKSKVSMLMKVGVLMGDFQIKGSV